MKAMYVIYCEITEEVERYAQANGVVLVMDYPSDKVDIDVPADDSTARQRPFVYQGGAGHYETRAGFAQSASDRQSTAWRWSG